MSWDEIGDHVRSMKELINEYVKETKKEQTKLMMKKIWDIMVFWKKQKLHSRIFISNVITALILTAILGPSLATFAVLLMLLDLNILAIPLILFVPLFQGFPLWVYYIIVIGWGGQILVLHEFDKIHRVKA